MGRFEDGHRRQRDRWPVPGPRHATVAAQELQESGDAKDAQRQQRSTHASAVRSCCE